MANLSTVTVRDYMATELVTFTPDMAVTNALSLLVKHGHSGAPVVEEGRQVRLLSEKDCLKVAPVANFAGLEPGSVRDFMTSSVATVTPDTDLLEVASRFVDAPFKRLPVVENGQLIGQISRSDVLRAIHDLT
jgi:CBS domain-containing protein